MTGWLHEYFPVSAEEGREQRPETRGPQEMQDPKPSTTGHCIQPLHKSIYWAPNCTSLISFLFLVCYSGQTPIPGFWESVPVGGQVGTCLLLHLPCLASRSLVRRPHHMRYVRCVCPTRLEAQVSSVLPPSARGWGAWQRLLLALRSHRTHPEPALRFVLPAPGENL